MQARTILVHGVFVTGTKDAPLARPTEIVLVNDETPIARGQDITSKLFTAPYGAKMIAALGNGRWEAHGVGRTPIWTRLVASVKIGDTQLQLEHANNWRVGDEVIVTSTDFQPEQTERLTIKAVSNGGRTIQLEKPLLFNHHGKNYEKYGFNVTMRAEVGVLTSNFKIYGEMTNVREKQKHFRKKLIFFIFLYLFIV